MRIALDAMGGDFAPGPIVNGAVHAVEANDQLHVVLVGDEPQVRACLAEGYQNHPQLSFVHTTQVLGMDEKPSELRRKPDSSIAKIWQLMATRQVDAVVSAGNTGAVAAGGLFTKLFLKGVKRPGIAVVMPTMRGPCVLLDVGANAACKPEHLYQYGVIGSLYAQKIVGIESPKIGLMSIGTEDGKGNDLVRETRDLFRASQYAQSFHGMVEGRDLYAGTVNVVVCDGFTGNVILKVSESVTDFLLHMAATKVLPALDADRAKAEAIFKGLGSDLHHESFGGAPLLGVDGVCIICHGSSKERAIRNALATAVKHHDTHLNAMITEGLTQSPAAVAES